MRFYLSTMADITMDEGEGRAAVVYQADVTTPLAARRGLGIELAEFCTAENLDAGFAETDALVRGKLARVPDAVLHAPYYELYPSAIDPRAAELAAFRYGQALSAAESYGIRKLVIHGGYVPLVYYPGWFVERSVAFWRAFLAAHPGDYVLCLENVMEPEPELLCRVAEQVGDPRLRLCLDVGHANLTPVPPERWLEACAPWLAHLHIHNNAGERDTHDAPGDGRVDVAALLRRCAALCPEATATVESMAAERSADWLRENGFGED